MTQTTRLSTAVLALLALLVLLPAPLPAQEAPDPAEKLEDEKKRLEKYEGSEKEEDKRWVASIEERIRFIEKMIATQKREDGLPDPDALEKEKKGVEREIEVARKLPEPKKVNLESLARLSDYEDRYQDALRVRDDAIAAITVGTDQRVRDAGELKALPARETEAKKRLDSLTGEDELSRYRAISAQLELAVVSARRRLLQPASKVNAALVPLRQSQLDLAEIHLKLEEKILALARDAATGLRAEEAEKAKEKARTEAAAAERAKDPVVKFTALMAAEAATVNSQTQATAIAATQASTEVRNRKEMIKRLRLEREYIEKRLGFEDPGVTDILRNSLERSDRAIQNLRQNVAPKVAEAAAKTQKELIDVLDRIWELQLPDDENSAVAQLRQLLPEDRSNEAPAIARKVLEDSKGLLGALRTEKVGLEALQALQGELAALVVEAQEEFKRFKEFARSELVFSQSDVPLSVQTFVLAAEEIPEVVSIYSNRDLWRGASSHMAELTRAILLLAIVLLLSAAVIVVPAGLRRRRHRQQAEEDTDVPVFMGHGAATVQFIGAVLPPLGLLLTSVFVERLDLPSPLGEALPPVFLAAAGLVAIQRFSAWFFHARGPGIHLVGVFPDNASRIRRIIRICTLSGLLLAVPAVFIEKSSANLTDLPRVLDTAWITILAFGLILLLRRRGPLIRQVARPGRLLDRLWIVMGPLLSLALIALVILEIGGYRVAAWTFMGNIVQSVGVVILVAGLYAFLVRIIGRVSKQVRKRMIIEEGYEAAQESSSAVSDQLTRLAAILIVFAALLVLMASWDDKMVGLEVLREVQILETEPGQFLTLLDVLEALLLIVAGHFVVGNLSAVYQFVVFPLLGSTNRGGQYVLLALSRYAILLLAYSAALLVLGLKVSNLAWLLTAASVGIGFGLQEIIANFISGLIILLERPIQVGDIITVDDTEGTVDKITIRSTIVTNWDRQSIVIPNKDFITKKLTNWTRNDDIMRRRIVVRAGFGTDVPKLLRVLGETVKAHPKVLADPPHRVWIWSYTDAGLEVMVFFFTKISDGLDTRAQLHQAIYERLAEEGIEIPIPRRRIFVMHDPESLGAGGSGGAGLDDPGTEFDDEAGDPAPGDESG